MKKNHYTDTKAATAALMRAKQERLAKGILPSVSTRMIVNDEAFAIVKDMSNAEFREFVSAAILNHAKGKRRS